MKLDPIPPDEFRKARLALGLSQGELGRRLGYSRITINKWERGHMVKGIPARVRKALARLEALGCESGGASIEADREALGRQFEACGCTEADDPDGWKDEAEDKATTDEERADNEHVPVIDLWPEEDEDD